MGAVMIALIQRVSRARVVVEQETVGAIDHGMLALIGIEKDDSPQRGERLLHRLLHYRIFPDDQGRMNLNLQQVQGGLLLVSQFTLVADTRKGNRPSFSAGASPERGKELFEQLVAQAQACHQPVASGVYAADMQVELVNDGPVTFWLQA